MAATAVAIIGPTAFHGRDPLTGFLFLEHLPNSFLHSLDASIQSAQFLIERTKKLASKRTQLRVFFPQSTAAIEAGRPSRTGERSAELRDRNPQSLALNNAPHASLRSPLCRPE
jgi:hypothetical protein